MKILVTGASGFIGQACCKLLQAQGIPFVGVASHARGLTLPFDLLNLNEIQRCLSLIKPTHILHLAWYTGVNYAESEQNNAWLKASQELVKNFVKVGGQRFVGVGTCFEYIFDGLACNESQNSITTPHTLYGFSKLKLAHYVQSFAHSISWAWCRPFYVFGAKENSSRLIASAALSFANNKDFCTAALQRYIDYIDVDDVAKILINILFSQHCGRVNVGRGKAYLVGDILRELASRFSPSLQVLPSVKLDNLQPIVADVSTLHKVQEHIALKPLDVSLDEYYEVYKCQICKNFS